MYLSRFPLFRVKQLNFINYCSKTSDNFELIYSGNYARMGGIVNRIKLQQTILTAVAIPVTYSLEMVNILPSNFFLSCSVIGLSINAVCYGIGQIFHNFIGKAYINEDSTSVKLSFVGFFGKRVDHVVPREDIYLDDKSGKLYTTLFVEKLNLKLKIQEKYYDYCNMQLARKAFGESFNR